MKITADAPIRNPEDDVLGRANLASSFSQQILLLDSSEGLVIGVLGPWGSGKTSFINLVRPHLESACVPVLDFNTWMFSGTDQLVEAFFGELSAQLKVRGHRRFNELGKSLESYGEIFSGLGWLPIVGSWMDRLRLVITPLAKLYQRRKEGVAGRKIKVEKALANLGKPLVVVVDDIDRLTTSEIRDVFKLVRLTACFPNIMYITAFDRFRVEEALTENGICGRDYLEKILQSAFDLPTVPPQVLEEQALLAIDEVLSGIRDAGRFDKALWPDVFIEVIRPLLRNMRDLRRYATAIQGTVQTLNGQVALVDVLGLEAVRVFLPDLSHSLHEAIDGLTTTSEVGSRHHDGPSPPEKQINKLIERAGDHGSVAQRLIHHLFPAGQRHIGGTNYGNEWENSWLKDRRVAHADVLRLYLDPKQVHQC